MVQMKVWKLILDGRTDTPVVILQELEGKRILPIWIGKAEARAIAMELAREKFQRPLTHDLMKTIIDALGGSIRKVTIGDLKDNTFFAQIFVDKDDEIISIDARPSDSLALALRTRSAIYVAEAFLQDEPDEKELSDDERAEALRKYLDRLDPEDFGKFPGGSQA